MTRSAPRRTTLLRAFPPGPLPGVESPAALGALVGWALPLLQSARVHESDAAAFVLRLAFQRYVLGLRWTVVLGGGGGGALRADVDAPAAAPAAAAALDDAVDAAEAFVGSLLAMLDARVESRPLDVAAATDESALHGALVVLRLVLKDLDAAGAARRPPWRAALRRWPPPLLVRCARVSQLALGIISDPSPEGFEPGADANGQRPDPAGFPGVRLPDGGGGSVADVGFAVGGDDGAETPTNTLGKGKLLVVLCWLAIKEASLLVGQAVQVFLPLPRAAFEGRGGGKAKAARAAAGDGPDSDALLNCDEVDAAGRSLVRTLLATRHNGAIEKASTGLALVCERLLASDASELAALPAAWLDELLSTASRGATTFLRRSAGLPFAVLAVLYAEHNLSKGGGAMIGVALRIRLLARAADEKGEEGGEAEGESEWGGRVHALNLLRHIYQDKAFGAAVMSHVADGFLCAFSALASARWAVRNSGTLLLASLLERALRCRRSRDEHAEVNALGIRDFARARSGLHAFLLRRLRRGSTAAPPTAPTATRRRARSTRTSSRCCCCCRSSCRRRRRSGLRPTPSTSTPSCRSSARAARCAPTARASSPRALSSRSSRRRRSRPSPSTSPPSCRRAAARCARTRSTAPCCS